MIGDPLSEVVARESLYWNFYTRLDMTPGNDFIQNLGQGVMLWDPNDTTSFTGHLAGVTGPPCSTEFDPVACAKFVGRRSDAIVIHHVVKMYLNGDEVDPLDEFRATQMVDFPSMMIISNNPCKGCRPDPPIGQAGATWPPDTGTPGWADDSTRPPTPNLLGHELVHPLTGLLDETRDFLVHVSDPTAQIDRGYRLDSKPPNALATHAQNCAIALAGIPGVGDFTR